MLLHNAPPDSWSCNICSIDQVKGWTRSSIVLTMLIAASEVDLSENLELLKPMAAVLEKAWMVPVHVFCLQQVKTCFSRFFTVSMPCFSSSLCCYFFFTVSLPEQEPAQLRWLSTWMRPIDHSYRGSERQAPNTLQLALRFSKVMEARQNEGRHLPSMSVDERLRDVVKDWHSSTGLQAKHRLDEDRMKAVGNIISGTSVVFWFHFRCFFFCVFFWPFNSKPDLLYFFSRIWETLN